MFGSKPCPGCVAHAQEIAWRRAQNERLTSLIAEERKPGVLRRVETPQPHNAPLPRKDASAARAAPLTFPGYEPLPPREEVDVT